MDHLIHFTFGSGVGFWELADQIADQVTTVSSTLALCLTELFSVAFRFWLGFITCTNYACECCCWYLLLCGSWRSFVHIWVWNRHARPWWTEVRRRWRAETLSKISLSLKKRFYSRQMRMRWHHTSCGVCGQWSNLASQASSLPIWYVQLYMYTVLV